MHSEPIFLCLYQASHSLPQFLHELAMPKKIKNKILKETIYKQMMNALTEYKVFESKSRTLSFCWVRSTFAKLSISCAIEGYLDPLDMSTTCKQTNDIRIFIL
jgi:hypothetical protein